MSWPQTTEDIEEFLRESPKPRVVLTERRRNVLRRVLRELPEPCYAISILLRGWGQQDRGLKIQEEG